MSQRVRLSGEDIQFINQLRGYKQPVYETVNGRLCFRVTLTNEELKALQRNREERVKGAVCAIGSSIRNCKTITNAIILKDYEVTVQFKHKKKGYTTTHKI